MKACLARLATSVQKKSMVSHSTVISLTCGPSPSSFFNWSSACIHLSVIPNSQTQMATKSQSEGANISFKIHMSKTGCIIWYDTITHQAFGPTTSKVEREATVSLEKVSNIYSLNASNSTHNCGLNSQTSKLIHGSIVAKLQTRTTFRTSFWRCGHSKLQRKMTSLIWMKLRSIITRTLESHSAMK